MEKIAHTKCVIRSQKGDNDPQKKIEITIAQNAND
jgi:hypothetical protein